MSLTISENTLLKILVRRGSNQERKNVTLSEGEVGYTVDSKRLFVGDGSTKGGFVAGSKYYGVADSSSASMYKTQIASFGVQGDYVYDQNDSLFYIITAADGLSNDNYFPIGGANIVLVDNVKVAKNSAGVLTLLPLSANALDSNTLRGGLSAVSNTLQLGPTIYVNNIAGTTLSVPGILNVGSTQFNIQSPITVPGILYWSSGIVTTRPIPSPNVFIAPVDVIRNTLGISNITLYQGSSTYTVNVATSAATLSGFPEGIQSVQLVGQYSIGGGQIEMYVQTDRSASINNPITVPVVNSSSSRNMFNTIVPLSGVQNSTDMSFTYTVSTNASTGNFYLSVIGVGY